MIGGAGDDNLRGGVGHTTFIFEQGWGYDTLMVGSYGASILFREGIDSQDSIISRGNDLILHYKDGQNSLTVDSYFDFSDTIPTGSFHFTDGTIWTPEQLLQWARTGTERDDSIVGGKGNDYLTGAAGNDTLYGGYGDDTLEGGTGNDSLQGAEGNDLLLGGDGNDILAGYDGNDTLEGGAGNDLLNGGTGDDFYMFEQGWGNDTINGERDRNANTINFKSGIKPSDIQLSRINNDLYFRHKATGDLIQVVEWINYQDQTNIRQIVFSDGTLWDDQTIRQLLLVATDGNDSMQGYKNSNNLLNGGLGNDTLRGYAGDDTLIGGAGDDILYSGNGGNNLLVAGDGNDKLYAEPSYDERGSDSLYGGAGDDYLYVSGNHNTLLDGGEGNDTLHVGGHEQATIIGGQGNDFINITGGSNTLIFDRGWGYDTIYGGGDNELTNIIQFGEGISFADLTFERLLGQSYYGPYLSNGCLITLKGTTDKIQIDSFFGYEYVLLFSDGTIVNKEAIKKATMAFGSLYMEGEATDDYIVTSGTAIGNTGNDTIIGGSQDNILYGEEDNDYLDGRAGNDTLYGGDGNDTLIGGEGNDSLHGEAGNDTYLFQRGWGNDTIYNATSLRQNEQDRIIFGEGISSTELTFTRSGSDLIIGLKNAADTITIQYYFRESIYDSYQVQAIQFADGTQWNNTEINQHIGKKITGTDNDDLLQGGLGDDSLYGGYGNDTLIGGVGNNLLMGENGTDTYQFSIGWGNDTIYNNYYQDKSSDIIQFGEGIRP